METNMNQHFAHPPMEDYFGGAYPMSPMMPPMGDPSYLHSPHGIPGCHPPVTTPCPQMPMPPMPQPMPMPMPMPMPPDYCMPEDPCEHMEKLYYMYMYMAAMHKAEAYKQRMMLCGCRSSKEETSE